MAQEFKNIVVDFADVNISVQKKIERDLIWHDPLQGKLLKFKGGRLTYEYRLDPWLVNLDKSERERLRLDERGYKSNYRLLPKIVDVYEKTQQSDGNNRQAVIDWFKRYHNYNNTKSDVIAESDKRVVFRVPEKEYRDFIYELDKNNFKHWEQ